MRLFWRWFTPVLTFVAGYLIGTKKNGRTIPCGQHEDAGASRSPTSPDRSDSGPSGSSASVTGNNYYIFLSFRGSDTRNGFVDHLYRKLQEVGLPFHPNFVFKDDKDLCFGKNINTSLQSAIEHSKVSILVISENYAASEWCLCELIQIIECMERGQQKVLPVLYKVKTSDVRNLEGAFGEAFKSNMHLFKEDVKRQGPVALKKVVASRVLESEKLPSRYEGELVEKIVQIIKHQWLHDFPPSLPLDLVGIDGPVAEVMKLVDTAPSKTQTIVICGIGGIGKTTLATVIYNKIRDKFEHHSFLKDIRETIKSKGMEHVQSLLISNITKDHHKVPDSEIGITMIQRGGEKKKVLILLDDVDCRDHLDNLIGGCNFESGSRIIITCQDKALLKSEHKRYELKEMNSKDSLLLFNRYAFVKEQPLELAALSNHIVATTGGLPLALMIIGSFLKGKCKNIWIETLEKLRKVPNKDVQKMLSISYNSLDHETRQIFLDIACFFIGIDKRIATYLWKDLQLCQYAGLDRLTELSLIKCDDEDRLRMHDQLRDLGRAMARPAYENPWDCSRLWGEDAIIVQQSKEENKNIQALHLDENGSIKFMMRESFKRMPFLKFLHLSKVDFVGDFDDTLTELRWLWWEMCPDSFKANNVHLEKLLILDLSYGFISDKWGGWSSIKMERLKVLNLSWCSELKSTPNLSEFKSLERLNLEHCDKLKGVDPSIGDVKCLVSLNLRYCGSLKNLPAQLGELRKLEELLVDETDIEEIPTCIQFLTELKMLSAMGCRLLTQVPDSISLLVNLLTLNLNTCKKLRELPKSFQAHGKLQRLSLVRCYMLREIPSSIGELGELVELDLSSTGVKELPKSIEKLKNLEILRFAHSEMEKLPRTIGKLESLQELDASGCRKLEGRILVDIGGLSSLRTVRLGKAKISHLPENFRELSTLEHLDLLNCSELQSLPEPPSGLSSLQVTCLNETLPSLSHLRILKELALHACMSLQSIPELPSCIRKLRVWKCPRLERLSNLPNLKSLLELELLQCYGLKELDGLEALESLRKLDVSISTELSNLNNFEDLDSLRDLDMQSYDREEDNLQEIPGLGKLKSLEVLNISERKHIQRLDLSNLEHLKELIVKNCKSLTEIHFHDKIKSLERFDRDGCPSHLIVLPTQFQRERAAKS